MTVRTYYNAEKGTLQWFYHDPCGKMEIGIPMAEAFWRDSDRV